MTALPSSFTKKYARKDMTGEALIADLDRRYWNMDHELLETIVRPTGNTYVVRASHRLDRDHGPVCPWCPGQAG